MSGRESSLSAKTKNSGLLKKVEQTSLESPRNNLLKKFLY
jgi:hypothetical protein